MLIVWIATTVSISVELLLFWCFSALSDGQITG